MELFELDLNSWELTKIDCVRKEVALRLFSGVGLFETTKILNGVPLFVEEHVGRILDSTRRIWGDHPDRSTIEAASFYVSRKRKVGMLRIFLVEGKGNFYVFFLVDDFPYKTTENLSVKILDYERNPGSFISGMKPISYFENVVLRENLEREGFDEGIFLSRGFVAEGTRSNIFWIKDDVVFTPPLELGILKGIIRGKVIDICRKYNLKVREVKRKPEELMKADEVFLTSSLLGVAPCKLISFGKKRKVFRTDRRKKRSLSYFIRQKLEEVEMCHINSVVKPELHMRLKFKES